MVKCTDECPDDLTPDKAMMRPKCDKAMEYGECRKFVYLDKLGLEVAKIDERT